MMVVAAGNLSPGAWSLTDDTFRVMRLGSKPMGFDHTTPLPEEVGGPLVVVYLHSILEDFVCDPRAVSTAVVFLDAGWVHVSDQLRVYCTIKFRAPVHTVYLDHLRIPLTE